MELQSPWARFYLVQSLGDGESVVNWAYSLNINEPMVYIVSKIGAYIQSHQDHLTPSELPEWQKLYEWPQTRPREDHSLEPSPKFLSTELWVNKMVVVLNHWVCGGLLYKID